jgi:inhibitor of KinA sporulation pathway (predicted exonuclease)
MDDRKKGQHNLLYDYLLIMHFETCSCTDAPQGLSQEIIEFSWVVFDHALAETADMKQFFVKPEWAQQAFEERPHLQYAAESLQSVVQYFDNYVFSNFIRNNKAFCLLTDGPWDIKLCLREEARIKGVKLAAHYSKFFDLRVEFKKMYPRAPSVESLRSILDFFGLSSREHKTALDECQTIATVVQRMVKDGHLFSTPEIIPDNWVPSNHSISSNVTGNLGGATNETTAVTATKVSSSQGNMVLRLRGLPWEATEGDIDEFFQTHINASPTQIVMALTYQGRPTGEAFVKFATPELAQRAMSCHRKHMGRRYIEIFPSSDLEIERVLSRTLEARRSTAIQPQVIERSYPVVRVRGLPYSANIADIQSFFAGLAIAPHGIHIVCTYDGRPSGEAYVELLNDDQVAAALKKNKELIGNRYIEVFTCQRRDFQYALAHHLVISGGDTSSHNADYNHRESSSNYTITNEQRNNYPHHREYIMKMRGLPWQTTERDIMTFFEGCSILPGGIHICRDSRDRATGEAFVEFENEESFVRAYSRNKDRIGTR